jgi:bacterioferritin
MPTKDIIPHLNAALKSKLTGINQYFLHARMLKNQGNVKLADYVFKASLDAMKHADMLVERVLALGGAPNLQELGKLAIGTTSVEMLKNDLTLAESVFKEITTAIETCEKSKDSATAGLLTRIRDSQQEHINFIKTQINIENRKECA